MSEAIDRPGPEASPSLAGAIDPVKAVSRLIVLMPSWVGDVTMATPLLRALRTARPRATIAALLRPGLAPLLESSPWLDASIEARMRGMAGPWTGLAEARAFEADTILLLPNSLRSGLAALRLARRRIGYATQLRRWTLTDPIQAPSRRRPTPAVDFYCALGEAALDAPISDRRIELPVSASQALEAERLVGALGDFLLVNPGANRVDKRWPADRFASAASSIAREHALAVAITGSRAESLLTAQVAAGVRSALGAEGRVVDLAASGVALGSLKGVIREARLLLTNDTGPRHLAAALGTPSVVLFGPTDHRWTTLAPEQAGRDRLLLAEPFLPEQLQADDCDEVCRIERITVEDVVAAARASLGSPAASAPRR